MGKGPARSGRWRGILIGLVLLTFFVPLWPGLATAAAAAPGGTSAVGNLVAWGSNSDSQTTIPSWLSGVTAIAAGEFHTLALRTDGSVVLLGGNDYDNLDIPPAAQSGVVAIAASYNHNLALKANGQVVAWGNNQFGKATVPAAAQSGVVAIAAGSGFSLALKADGEVIGWGRNASQEITIPTAAQSNVIAISAGEFHALALKADGEVIAWGSDLEGQATVQAQAQSGVKAIAAGGFHNVVLKSDGTTFAWGASTWGQISIPAAAGSGVVAIEAGPYHNLALKADGTVVAWGRNDDGEEDVPQGLTGATAISAGGHHSLALVGAGKVMAAGEDDDDEASPPPGLTGVIAVSGGSDHSLALKSNGEVVGWGTNLDNVSTVPAAAQSGVAAISAGPNHNLVLKADGTLVAWGSNSHDQATIPPQAQSGIKAIAAGYLFNVVIKDDGTIFAWGNDGDAQTQVPLGLDNVVAIAVGDFHVIALKADGSVVGWGKNDRDQADTPPQAQSGVTAIAAGGAANLVLKANGTVFTWGETLYDQQEVPPGLSGVTMLAAVGLHMTVLKADSTVAAWGSNGSGQTDIPASASAGVAAVANGWGHTLYLGAAQSQTIMFPVDPLPDRVYGTAPFALVAAGGGSGNPVTFASTTPAVCTTSGVNGATLTLLKVGTCTIAANQAGKGFFFAAAQQVRSFEVTKAPLTVTADDKVRAYAAANPPLTVSYVGFVNGDDVADLGGALECATTAKLDSPPSPPTYPITCSGQTSTNYTITYQPGTLTIGEGAVLDLTIVGPGVVELVPAGAPLGDGATRYALGTLVTLTPQAQGGALFTGWVVDGVSQGWPDPLDITLNANHAIVATFATPPAFPDLAPNDPAYEALRELAARGIIKGYVNGDAGAGDTVQRAQLAALIVRALDLDSGQVLPPSPFPDLGGVTPGLARAIALLADRGVLKGYLDGTFGPNDPLAHYQLPLVISRAMVAEGHWSPAVVDDPTVYPNVVLPPNGRLDLVTYVQNAGAIPDRPATQDWADWGTPSSRGWAARVLWQALDATFSVDNVP